MSGQSTAFFNDIGNKCPFPRSGRRGDFRLKNALLLT